MEHNKAQEKVISTIEGQMIVIGCPGSGKTTTLLKRIDHMVHSGIDPENILMIIFTSAAAKEAGKPPILKSIFLFSFPQFTQDINGNRAPSVA